MKKMIPVFMLIIGGLSGAIGWQLGHTQASSPPEPPAIGTTQATVESIWGQPIDSTSFTVELSGEPVTIVKSRYVKRGSRIQIEYDRQLMVKTVKILE